MKTSTIASLVLSLGMLVACGGSVSLGSNGGQLQKGEKCTTCTGPVQDDARVCPDGTAKGRECLSLGDGTCGYDFPACASPTPAPGPAGSKCTTCTGPIREDARMCPNGTGIGRECLYRADGTCDYDFPACPGDCSAPAACGDVAVPTIAKQCSDGSAVGYTCNLQSNGACGYSFACPGDACQDVECGPVIEPANCSDGTRPFSCKRVSGGACRWVTHACAQDGGAAPDGN